ncbi:hypothetical protein SARC_08596 [Sphaeroforma arctica JP610]|uniref:Glycoside-hydrolase family GH114 TIM-barrel domain-containing protein n=1 Tax=Sphaeroforma arctica JP610 TaxID=667725 RepID=A0A0L0FQD2_9EUKA|nr:hypothetical protein SARC_08596 [Sphaeroforma arctica JP610]KNC78995.1 hypothetical protein SARC_08596 [Sphaeroforma arctica JP610]|eukprot:XP_014152897.1 hypothetical protein SARC_08596 [Sphaeroforma arctica JP610]
MSIKSSLLLAVASIVNANALSKNGAATSAPSMCNRARSNTGAAKETNCSGAKDFQIRTSNPWRTLSVSTVQEDRPADPRISDYIWEENDDANGYGGHYDEIQSFDAISTDNASPSDAVTDNDSEAAEHHTDQRVDPRLCCVHARYSRLRKFYCLEVALKNPSYYIHESSLIGRFDGYIVESLFNWYPYDIDNYNGSPNLLTGSKPFQYEGTNGVSNSKLRERMNEQGVDMVYMDTYDGWDEYYANDDE